MTSEPITANSWSRTIETEIGGRCAQWFVRVHHLTVALGWVTRRYRDVPNFFYFKHRFTPRCVAHALWIERAVELHIWRVRFGFKYWR